MQFDICLFDKLKLFLFYRHSRNNDSNNDSTDPNKASSTSKKTSRYVKSSSFTDVPENIKRKPNLSVNHHLHLLMKKPVMLRVTHLLDITKNTNGIKRKQ